MWFFARLLPCQPPILVASTQLVQYLMLDMLLQLWSSVDINPVNGSGITQVNDLVNTNTMSRGKKVTTVLLFVGLCIAAYISFKGNEGKQEQNCCGTEPVDKRMSTISSPFLLQVDATILNSMIAVGNHSSAFSFRVISPSSTSTVEGDDKERSVSQMHTGLSLRHPILFPCVSLAPDTCVSSATDYCPPG